MLLTQGILWYSCRPFDGCKPPIDRATDDVVKQLQTTVGLKMKTCSMFENTTAIIDKRRSVDKMNNFWGYEYYW